jgi:arsenite-transporting ATPase
MKEISDRKILFFIGKGGVGKSTVSSITAVDDAKNKNVLLVSLDPAHNLSDIFQTKLTDKLKSILPNLSVFEVNISLQIKKYLSDVENELVKSNSYLSAFNLLNEFKILKDSPGIEEYGLLLAFQEIINKHSDKEIIIIDMPPTALALKFFKLPSISIVWINKLISLRERIKEKKEIVSRVKLGKSEIEKDKVLAKLNSLKDDYKKIEKIFKSKNVEINLVINTDTLSQSEAERIINKLSEVEIVINKIVINKCNSNFNFENKKLSEYEITTFPMHNKALVGVDSLKELFN